MRKIKYLILVLFLFSNYLNAQNKVWTLSQCINQAYEKNIQIRQSKLSNEINKVNLEQTKANRIPGLNAGTSQNYTWGTSMDPVTGDYQNKNYSSNNFNISSSVTLFNGFKNLKSIRQNEINYKAGKYKSEQIKENVSLLITEAYLQILYAKENLKNFQEQLNVSKQQVIRTKIMVDAGMMPQSNLLEMKAQYSSDKLALTNAKNQLATNKVNLMQLMELPLDSNFEIKEPALNNLLFNADNNNYGYPEKIYSQALKVKPEIKNAVLNTKSKSLAIDIARSSLYPRLSLNGNLTTRYSSARKLNKIVDTYYEEKQIGYLQSDPTQLVMTMRPYNVISSDAYRFLDQINDNFFQSVSLNLSIPIFNNKQAKSSISRAKINKMITELDEQNVKNDLRKKIEQAWLDVIAAQKEYVSNKEQYVSFKQSYNNSVEKFNIGMLNSIDFLTNKTKYIQARNSLINAKYNYIFKMKILDFYTGKPLTL